jgi:pyrroline-5-carboxylate reductase
MISKSFGFIGGGRAVKIILGGLKKINKIPSKIIVSDVNIEMLNSLKSSHPDIYIVHGNNYEAAKMDVVILSLHPPVFPDALKEISGAISENTMLISFAPKISIEKISAELNGFNRIVRVIPNAPSIINSGYNPIHISESFSELERKQILSFFELFGKCPEVKEENLEAYAILAAMGPTYFWFQLYEIMDICASFGLSEEEIKSTIPLMLEGSIKTIFDSGLKPAEVIDLIPVKPIGEEEENIRNIYKTKLIPLFKKLKGL